MERLTHQRRGELEMENEVFALTDEQLGFDDDDSLLDAELAEDLETFNTMAREETA
jgi:hypothetical protein